MNPSRIPETSPLAVVRSGQISRSYGRIAQRLYENAHTSLDPSEWLTIENVQSLHPKKSIRSTVYGTSLCPVVSTDHETEFDDESIGY